MRIVFMGTPDFAVPTLETLIQLSLIHIQNVTVHLLGGDLYIVYDREAETVFMTGPATVVFDGEIDITDIDVQNVRNREYDVVCGQECNRNIDRTERMSRI